MELTQIQSLGSAAEKALNQLNIYRIEDLVEYYPYRYEYLNPSVHLVFDSKIVQVINVVVESEPKIAYIRRNFNTLRFQARFQNQVLQVSIFNRAFLKRNLTLGKEITLIGKYDEKKNQFVASDLKVTSIHVPKITPIYHLSRGIKNGQLEKWILASMKLNWNVVDHIPSSYVDLYHFISKKEAIQLLHFPTEIELLKKAKLRLIYEELFEFMFKILCLKEKETFAYGLKRNFDLQQIWNFIETLPFSLTKDQLTAIQAGLNDLSSEKRMNRLLLGDVGSGKTVVAFILMYANVLSGYQSVLMAPTEILATQHYFSFLKLFETLNLRVQLLVGSMKKREKERAMSQISDGEIDIIIGTHALLNESLIFANLGLVVTDEQHRFGVNQRNMLQNKGYRSDVLYLSATPIPRTYALTIYGDMDTSMIMTKPSGRKKVITEVKKESELKEVLHAILNEVKKGHQIYVVSPLVEKNEQEELKDVNLLKEKFDLAFQGKVRTEILHGKMKASLKEEVMKDYESGNIRILISTTVIEVGVDVKNATMIVIFNAERFGLATLHQLRGRVGRNDLQCYCYLISNHEVERLRVLEESNDGFYISEKDFELRGQGDLFGVSQSGDMCFKIADIKRDYKILLQAKKDADSYLKQKEYINDLYYKKMMDQIHFTN
ncbi:MAG: ATP-dependent DNA helicase RecG [Bacilli bacterium]|jgi:ATP-dependent DNA helicase RecG|nr:ATP-dependent DNA helicase RecG [Bacilli bacterium]